MEYDQLKGFFYVAKLGSFTQAAGRLYLSQPAISLQVKALEKEIGERLFDRVGRKIRLTHSGEVLFKETEELVGKLDEIQSIVQQFKSVGRGRLKLGASDTTSIHVLPRLLQDFLVEYPNVDLTVSSAYSTDVKRLVIDRELDVGIVTLPVSDSRLDVVPLFSQVFAAIVPSKHPFAARKQLRGKDFASTNLILLESGSTTRQIVDAFLAGEGVAPAPNMEFSNFEIIKRYVAEGLGVSVVPRGAVDEARDGVRVVTLQRKVSVESGAIYRRDRRISHTARAFVDMARSYFLDDPRRSFFSSSAEAN